MFALACFTPTVAISNQTHLGECVGSLSPLTAAAIYHVCVRAWVRAYVSRCVWVCAAGGRAGVKGNEGSSQQIPEAIQGWEYLRSLLCLASKSPNSKIASLLCIEIATLECLRLQLVYHWNRQREINIGASKINTLLSIEITTVERPRLL